MQDSGTAELRCYEAEFGLESFLFGDDKVLRGVVGCGDLARSRLLQIGVLIIDSRDVWFELSVEQSAQKPEELFFSIRFVAEEPLSSGHCAMFIVDEKSFPTQLDAACRGTWALQMADLVDLKLHHVRRPLRLLLGLPMSAPESVSQNRAIGLNTPHPSDP